MKRTRRCYKNTSTDWYCRHRNDSYPSMQWKHVTFGRPKYGTTYLIPSKDKEDYKQTEKHIVA